MMMMIIILVVVYGLKSTALHHRWGGKVKWSGIGVVVMVVSTLTHHIRIRLVCVYLYEVF